MGFFISKYSNFVYLIENKKEEIILHINSDYKIQFDLYFTNDTNPMFTWIGTDLTKKMKVSKSKLYKFEYSTEKNDSIEVFVWEEDDSHLDNLITYEDVIVFIIMTIVSIILFFIFMILIIGGGGFLIYFFVYCVNYLRKKCNELTIDINEKRRKKKAEKMLKQGLIN